MMPSHLNLEELKPMSDQIFALFLTLGFLILMVAWVPFLDFLQHVVRQSREGSIANSSRVQSGG